MPDKINIIRFSFRSLVFLLSLIIFLNGCATLKIPKYKVQHIEHYQNSDIKDGLMIAIHPMTDEDEMEKYFGTDLLSSNVFAVLVVVENKNPSSSFILTKDAFSLKGNSAIINGIESNNKVGDPTVATILVTTGYVLIPIVAITSLPLILIGGQMFSNSAAVRHNLKIKEFQNQTISPNEKLHGFVYFSLPEKNKRIEQFTLHIEALRIGSKEAINFNVPIKLEEI